MLGHNSPKLNSLLYWTVTAHNHTPCLLDVRIRFFRISLIYSVVKFCINFSFNVCIVTIAKLIFHDLIILLLFFGQKFICGAFEVTFFLGVYYVLFHASMCLYTVTMLTRINFSR